MQPERKWHLWSSAEGKYTLCCDLQVTQQHNCIHSSGKVMQKVTGCLDGPDREIERCLLLSQTHYFHLSLTSPPPPLGALWPLFHSSCIFVEVPSDSALLLLAHAPNLLTNNSGLPETFDLSFPRRVQTHLPGCFVSLASMKSLYYTVVHPLHF